MQGREKLTSGHLRRRCFIYPRQSSQGQLENHTESTARQYALVERAVELSLICNCRGHGNCMMGGV